MKCWFIICQGNSWTWSYFTADTGRLVGPTRLWDKEYSRHWRWPIRRTRPLPSQHDSSSLSVTREINGSAGRPALGIKDKWERGVQSETWRPCCRWCSGGVSNLLQVWMHHQDWRECEWSQSEETEVCVDSNELVVYVQQTMGTDGSCFLIIWWTLKN